MKLINFSWNRMTRMLNRKNRKIAVEELEVSIENYNNNISSLVKVSEKLYKKRENLKSTLKNVEYYLNLLTNKPKSMVTEIQEIQFSLENYQEMIDIMKAEIKKSKLTSGSSAVAGAAAGAGVAAFGPSVAMGIATTFGTASTGTAISTLTGAAASKAALAWLGGGALAAGGKGIAGGSALLGLAGPIGWTIGGASLIGSGLLLNGKNKKVIAEATKERTEVETKDKINQSHTKEIRKLIELTDETNKNLIERLKKAESYGTVNYQELTDNQKYELGAMINISSAGIEQLNKTIGEKE